MNDHVKDQTNIHVHLEKRMFWKVLRHVFVPSSGLEENNIKGAFYLGAPLAPLYHTILSSVSDDSTAEWTSFVGCVSVVENKNNLFQSLSI